MAYQLRSRVKLIKSIDIEHDIIKQNLTLATEEFLKVKSIYDKQIEKNQKEKDDFEKIRIEKQIELNKILQENQILEDKNKSNFALLNPEQIKKFSEYRIIREENDALIEELQYKEVE